MFSGAGPVQLARILTGTVPTPTLAKYDSVLVRLYGGWRSITSPTTSAQQLLPEILRDSPTVYQNPATPTAGPIRLLVELADRPIGWNVVLEQTMVKDRGLRRFRANPQLLRECVDIGNCGLKQFFSVSPKTACSNGGCAAELGNLLVRDEQKMVDTLLVADLAAQVFMQHANDVVVVSSDTDIWPGILLALRGGSNVIHIHPTPQGRTPQHLLRTLGSSLSGIYTELSL
jgi:uncharacterized LabA/DUF88 family protein